MNSQQLNSFLRRANYDRITVPDMNYVRRLITQALPGRIHRRMTGIKLLKRNVILEANRLRIIQRHIINLATNHFWQILPISQRNQFTTLANRVNSMNPNYTSRRDTLYRISQIPEQQETNNEFEDMFFHGSSFP
ncbi:6675_t:CDS:1 [Funneliformis caledonium]|uniref:6675_t:CDS:1 n=1 Tax=Funneliformis caledonium TaxID=1117310 RepID=A0A9N9CGI2_9GLOM|nr:6675_t:CDS:1 [Funneliformis caledonium]